MRSRLTSRPASRAQSTTSGIRSGSWVRSSVANTLGTADDIPLDGFRRQIVICDINGNPNLRQIAVTIRYKGSRAVGLALHLRLWRTRMNLVPTQDDWWRCPARALGPVLREYVVSEAMSALGVPTTRALAAVTTGEIVDRETPQPGAVLTRIAASHLRVGSVQYARALVGAGQAGPDLLVRLADVALVDSLMQANCK